mmetsp:Transcript_19070/g.53503  ORF Transcript_19070/g.53503 Transcript_19070/m.53503 type:complete len:203 (-) Transcript_19070:396-1004(-)
MTVRTSEPIAVPWDRSPTLCFGGSLRLEQLIIAEIDHDPDTRTERLRSSAIGSFLNSLSSCWGERYSPFAAKPPRNTYSPPRSSFLVTFRDPNMRSPRCSYGARSIAVFQSYVELYVAIITSRAKAYSPGTSSSMAALMCQPIFPRWRQERLVEPVANTRTGPAARCTAAMSIFSKSNKCPGVAASLGNSKSTSTWAMAFSE